MEGAKPFGCSVTEYIPCGRTSFGFFFDGRFWFLFPFFPHNDIFNILKGLKSE